MQDSDMQMQLTGGRYYDSHCNTRPPINNGSSVSRNVFKRSYERLPG